MDKEINAISIQVLEERMKPHPEGTESYHSSSGFLAETDSFEDVLRRDNDIVQIKKLTHLDVSSPLKAIVDFFLNEKFKDGDVITLNGNKYKIEIMTFAGYQDSPFEDGTKSQHDIYVTRLSDNTEISFSTLLPYMIAQYGFYEGNVRYRVAPETIIEFFNLAPEENINHQPRSAV